MFIKAFFQYLYSDCELLMCLVTFEFFVHILFIHAHDPWRYFLDFFLQVPTLSLYFYSLYDFYQYCLPLSWRRHSMKTFSASATLCEGNPLVTDGFTWFWKGQKCGYVMFLCCRPGQAVEQILDLPVIRDAVYHIVGWKLRNKLQWYLNQIAQTRL